MKIINVFFFIIEKFNGKNILEKLFVHDIDEPQFVAVPR